MFYHSKLSNEARFMH